MNNTKIENNWLKLLKGLLLTIFGLITLFRPDTTLVTLLKIFGAIAITAGIIVLFFSSKNRHLKGNNFWMAEGIVDIIIGLILIAFTEATVKIFVVIVALWAIVMGIIQLTTYKRYKYLLFNKNLQLLSGILTIIIGLILLFNPFEGGMVLVVLIGLLALFFGINTVVNSLKR